MAGNKQSVIFTERERHLLRSLEQFRVVDREQAKVITRYRSTTRVNVHLLKLVRAGALKRCYLGIGPGTKKAVYCLSASGAQLVGVPHRRVRIESDTVIGSQLYLEHRFRINEVALDLSYRTKPQSVLSTNWKELRQSVSPSLGIIPDAYIQLTTEQGTKSLFLEVDLGTETTRIWERKVLSYVALATSGEVHRLYGDSTFRVLVLTTSPKRIETIRQAVAKQTSKIFYFATFDDFQRAGLWAPIWLRPEGDQKHALL